MMLNCLPNAQENAMSRSYANYRSSLKRVKKKIH